MENTEKKIKVLIKPQCDAEIRDRFIMKFGEKCEFVFEENETRDSITTAEVVIGEPEESELQKAENLRWVQLTWAGADKYTKMKTFPTGVTLTNASGAFGKIISEYVIGNIIALYRGLPVYWKNKQERLWEQNKSSDTIYGKNILILGTGDIGRNLAHRMKAFETHVTGIKRTAVSEHSQHLKDFDQVYDLTALDEQLPQADIVIGCLPGTPETKGLLNYDRLHSMKKEAVLEKLAFEMLYWTGMRTGELITTSIQFSTVGNGSGHPHPAYRRPKLRRKHRSPVHDLEHLHGKPGSICEWKRIIKYCPVK